MQAIINAMPGSIALGLVWAMMAIGLFITFKVLNFADLTVDGSFCTGMVVFAMLVNANVNPWLAIIVSFVAGMAAGLVTGLLHTMMGIPAILSGILTQLALWSINLLITNGAANVAIDVFNDSIINSLYVGPAIGILCGVIAVIIGVLYWVFGTEIGSAIRATGSNLQMSKAQGINTKWTTILGLMISNGIVAFAGAFFAQYFGSADINNGRGAIVNGLAAIIIGEALVTLVVKCIAQIRKNKQKRLEKQLAEGKIDKMPKLRNLDVGKNFALRLTGVAVGAVVYFIVYQIVMHLIDNTNLLKLLSAAIVAVFLAIPYWKSQTHKRRKKENNDAKTN